MLTYQQGIVPVKITIQGAARAPHFRIGPKEIARAKQAIRRHPWAQKVWQEIKISADRWAARTEEEILSLIPEKGATFAFGATGSPTAGGLFSLHVEWDETGTMPRLKRKVKDRAGVVYPNKDCPDNGSGWRDESGKIYYFIGRYNSEIVDRLRTVALPDLSMAYALTGDKKYAQKVALILDALAEIYPTTTGHADYPRSSPRSGRLGQDWYYVGEGLYAYCLAYSLIYDSGELEKPSRVEGLTRKQNIIENMFLNGARYCVEESNGRGYIGPDLSNGMANYHLGTLAVGVTLGIPEYIDWVLRGPYGLQAMLDNTLDRDGLYYETAVNYANHVLEVWLALAEGLRHCDVPHDNPFASPRFQNALWFPNLKLTLAGHEPRFGDSPPDITRALFSGPLFDARDWSFLEHALAGVPEADKPRFEAALRQLTQGKIQKARAEANPAQARWLLFFAEPLEDGLPSAPVELPGQHSAFFDQKGVAILRSGEGTNARAVLMFYGPTLNHGHLDELMLNLVAKGYDWSYDLGKWGLGSKHTMSAWAVMTAAHNAVVVDEKNQPGPDAGGTLELFHDFGPVKVMRATSPCYRSAGVTRYRRTLAMLDTGPADSYYVDVFEVRGGKTHDFFFHSQNVVTATDAPLTEMLPGSLAGPDIDYGLRIAPDGDIFGETREGWPGDPPNGYGFIVENRRGNTARPFYVEWQPGRFAQPSDAVTFRLTHIPVQGEVEVTIGRGPGLYPKDPPSGVLRVRQQPLDGTSCFVSILEPYEGNPQVQSAEAALRNGVLSVTVRLRNGREDRLVFALEGIAREGAGIPILLDEGVCIARAQGNKVESFLLRGVPCDVKGKSERAIQREGIITAVDPQARSLKVKALAELPKVGSLVRIHNPAYNKQSIYRVAHAKWSGEEMEIVLEASSVILGRGMLEKDPPDRHTLPNITPFPWARRLRAPQYTGLLTGKRLQHETGPVETRIVHVEGRSAQRMTVKDTGGFRAGDRFVVYDIQAGDRVLIDSALGPK